MFAGDGSLPSPAKILTENVRQPRTLSVADGNFGLSHGPCPWLTDILGKFEQFGAILGYFGGLGGQFGAILGYFGPSPGSFGGLEALTVKVRS